jgi:hypothetical protein
MKTIKIYGASDDLIEVEGLCYDGNEYNAKVKGVFAGTLAIRDGANHVSVHCIYAGSWAFAVCPQGGDFDELPWDVRYSFGKNTPYSQTVEIDVPDNCTIEYDWFFGI